MNDHNLGRPRPQPAMLRQTPIDPIAVSVPHRKNRRKLVLRTSSVRGSIARDCPFTVETTTASIGTVSVSAPWQGWIGATKTPDRAA
jgi:hypothetical protein